MVPGALRSRFCLLYTSNIGKKIVEEEQAGTERAEYGKRLISILSDELTKEFGSGFSDRNLRNFRKFYLLFPDEKIWNACVPNLNWTHFRSLLRVDNEDARIWYMKEAASEGWSSRTLDRNISTQYYFRLLQSPKKEAVITEMQEKTCLLYTSYAGAKAQYGVNGAFEGICKEDVYKRQRLWILQLQALC